MPVEATYNPDVLSCIANLSSDEVFTPPQLVNRILDLLPMELWSDKNATFLGPGCKSGVFLREIAKRLDKGLEAQIPDRQKRMNHIFKNQLFGLAITELTALLSRRSVYCSKTANGKYSACEAFGSPAGNIRFKRIEHIWENGRCVYCGANEENYERGNELETHAYAFIHTDNPLCLFDERSEEKTNMKFDVIVSNPPYQLSDGGGSGTSAMPIYHKFVQQAKKLNPKFLTMIVPSRWFAGGKGLDEFRDEMLQDNRLRQIHDFIEAADCFPGVQIKGGVCYFLWDRNNPGNCLVSTHKNGAVNTAFERPLLEKNCDVFIRYNEAVSIFHKVQYFAEPSIERLVSTRRPFGFSSTFRGQKNHGKNSVRIFENGGIAHVQRSKVLSGIEFINKWKVFIPFLGSGSDSFPHSILGRPFIGEPGTVCTETYLLIGPFSSKKECENFSTYIATQFFRFLVLLKKPSQNATKKVYSFVPMQEFAKPWSDEKLYKKYGLTKDEIAFIESMVRPMPANDKTNEETGDE